MKIFPRKTKSTSDWGYWGEESEIPLGISDGFLEGFSKDLLHFHKEGIVFILATEGKGIIEVNGKETELSADELLRIDRQEKYRMVRSLTPSFRWITICTIKDHQDKVVVG